MSCDFQSSPQLFVFPLSHEGSMIYTFPNNIRWRCKNCGRNREPVSLSGWWGRDGIDRHLHQASLPRWPWQAWCYGTVVRVCGVRGHSGVLRLWEGRQSHRTGHEWGTSGYQCDVHVHLQTSHKIMHYKFNRNLTVCVCVCVYSWCIAHYRQMS